MKHLLQIKKCLEEIGYQSALFSESVGLWTGTGQATLVAHSRLPKDLRTAAFAVFDGKLGYQGAFATVRATGAALAIGVSGDTWQTCRIGRDALHLLDQGDIPRLRRFFKEHADDFNPDAIYRAKAWGRMDPTCRQLDFVDAGLMSIVEKDMGERLSHLLEECVHDLADDLGWLHLGDTRTDDKKAEWLIQAPFWLLAAKALRDKRVARFTRIDLGNFDDVFARLAKHYGSDESQAIKVLKVRQRALAGIAARIGRFASLELLTAEALGHVYESTLINKATRKKLGTHSTPPWLIDYILGKLRPWIATMPPAQRFVFEPACGHAGFLVAALRLLDELRPPDFPEPRNAYLRKRLHGVDVDSFSQEVARLALTLADVPNPNGWNLVNEEMFASDIIERGTQAANIVLLNPPFESFGKDGHKGWLQNKAAETLSRIVHNLPAGGVIGFIGPQGILQSKQARDLRRFLLDQYEIGEVLLVADKVFEYGEAESTVIVARRRDKRCGKQISTVRFARVREGDVLRFAETQQADLVDGCSATELLEDSNCPLFLPQCSMVWKHLRNSGLLELGSVAMMGQGLFHKGLGDFLSESSEPFPDGKPGFTGWKKDQTTHNLPEISYINLNPSTIDRVIMGLDDAPHVLLNYAPVSRGPWRLKALIDEAGYPVTSRFIVARPTAPAYSLPVLWALLNSPLANAFAFCHLSKRDNLVGTLRTLCVPNLDSNRAKNLERAANEYLNASRLWSAASPETRDEDSLPLFKGTAKHKSKAWIPTEEALRILHLRIDAEVMRLYDLPPALERMVLDLFADEPRKGVPFDQDGYFPRDLQGLNTVADLVSVVADWEPLAERESILIRKKVARKATAAELAELEELKRLSAGRLDLLAPMPLAEAEAAYQEAVRRASLIHPGC